jgi:hypothetical protein
LHETPLIARVQRPNGATPAFIGLASTAGNCRPKIEYTSKPRHVHYRAADQIASLPIDPRIRDPRRHSIGRFATGS